MSEISERFKEIYNKHQFENKSYYLYGSGGGCSEIIKTIEESHLTPPAAILDREKKTSPFSTVDAHTLDKIQYPVVVSSISFYQEIRDNLTKINPQFRDKLIPLCAYSENIKNKKYLTEKTWREYTWLSEKVFIYDHEEVNSELAERGFYIGHFPIKVANHMAKICARLPAQDKFSQKSEIDFNYFSNPLTGTDNTDLERLQFSPELMEPLQEFYDYHYDEVAKQLGSHWRIVNAKIKELHKVKNSNKGSNKLHLDSMPNGIRKILLYLTPPGPKSGSTLLKLSCGSEKIVSGPIGTWLLFDNSRLVHRGLSSDQVNRLICEITIAPSQSQCNKILISSHAAEYPYKPWKRCGSYKVNLGSGENFNGENWICFDERTGENIEHLNFSPKTQIPLSSCSTCLVYSSHFFEHINDETVNNLLKESYRILQENGDLLLKIPDFDTAVNSARNNDFSFFKTFPLNSYILKKWEDNKLDINSPYTFAANLITSYWDDNFGNLYQHGADRTDGYYGPAKLTDKEFRDTLSLNSIKRMSEAFTQKVRESENNFTFNHQNAWSRDEFITLVTSFGFEIVSCDYELIEYAFPDVPDLSAHIDISNYFYFKKTV